jgi:hypothetical protein
MDMYVYSKLEKVLLFLTRICGDFAQVTGFEVH